MLASLAEYYGLRQPKILMRHELLDRHVQWSKAANVRHNALVWTTLHTPLRIAKKLTGRST